MNPNELRYTESHEWVGESDGIIIIGITDHAQAALGDITYVELPEPGRDVQTGEEIAVVESVKAASDLYVPFDGHICDANLSLEDEPELVNKDPYGAGWFFKMQDVDIALLDDLMDAIAYKAYLAAGAD